MTTTLLDFHDNEAAYGRRLPNHTNVGLEATRLAPQWGADQFTTTRFLSHTVYSLPTGRSCPDRAHLGERCGRAWSRQPQKAETRAQANEEHAETAMHGLMVLEM